MPYLLVGPRPYLRRVEDSVRAASTDGNSDGPRALFAFNAPMYSIAAQRTYPLRGDEDVARKFGAMGFPTLVVVRPDGSIESRHVGLIEAAELEELVAAAAGVGAT